MTARPTIHSPLTIGRCRLKNRLVALPVFTGYAYLDGTVSPMLMNHYTQLAGTGVSMVVVANVAVAVDGITSRYNLRIDSDAFIPGLKGLATAIRKQGALACIQLNHGGRYAKTKQPLLASPVDASRITYNLSAMKAFINAFPLEKRLGLTRVFLKQINAWHRPMTSAEIETAIAGFREAALRAHRAGFDMIELHGANGYLICEFISPATNKRHAGFGGSFHNRVKFPLKIIDEIREYLPEKIPLGFRLLLREMVPGGVALPEAIALAKLLENHGVTYLSAATGTFNSIFQPEVLKSMARPAYLGADTAQLTRQVGIPTIISGRITHPALANRLLRSNTAHLIGLGRGLRVDPAWIKKAGTPGKRTVRCINCNSCLKRIVLEQGFNCVRWTKTRRQQTDLDHRLLARYHQSLWVITGREDMSRFQKTLPTLLPATHWPARARPTILFLRKTGTPDLPARAKAEFLQWAHSRLAGTHQNDDIIRYRDTVATDTLESTVHDEIMRSRYGVVFMGLDPEQPWRRRLLYMARHRVMGLVGTHPRPQRMGVPLDLSDTSLLILKFLQQTYANTRDIELLFFHILRTDQRDAKRKWRELKRIAGLEREIALRLISTGEEVSTAILDEITTHGCGTIIMGKRGLSGIKRLLVGSVSQGVFKGLQDQNLLLVD